MQSSQPYQITKRQKLWQDFSGARRGLTESLFQHFIVMEGTPR